MSLYAINRDIRFYAQEHGHHNLDIIPLLGSFTDVARLAFAFEHWKPKTVFHAAAYKHAQLVEASPVEGLRNNVLGIFEVVDAEHLAVIKDFIFICADKAVRPGKYHERNRKRCGADLASICGQTRGNKVLSGAVLQCSGLKRVGPAFIPAADPVRRANYPNPRDMTCCSMTIPEVALLVIQTSGSVKGGEIFILHMG